MSLSDQIVLIENALRDLIRDWERYFAGDLKMPPQAKHELIERRLRQLSGETMQRRADQFRIEQLQHRFTSYATNWNRMLREREEGRVRSPVAVQPRAAHREGTTDGATRSPVHQTEAGSLYDLYVAAKQEHDQEVRVGRQEFDAQIASEREKLESRLGQRVRFDVLVERGKVKLAARKERTDEQQE